MEISIQELIELQNNIAEDAERLGARECAASYDKRISALKQDHDKALHDVIARHLDEIATCGEKSFKAGAEQGRADGLRDCWHVVASVLQEVSKRHELTPVREILENVAKMAREGTIADHLAAPEEPSRTFSVAAY